MPYVWAIGLIWCGMSDAVLGAVAWCALFVFGTWLIEASKPIVQLLRDREALVWTIEVAMLTAASSNAIGEARPE